jgi:hypothetical protein
MMMCATHGLSWLHIQEVKGLERAMGFEPHSVADSSRISRRLPRRGPAPSCAPHERGAPLSKSPCRGFKSNEVKRLERAMGFEPTTTSLGS